jgi:outer membrane usher protein
MGVIDEYVHSICRASRLAGDREWGTSSNYDRDICGVTATAAASRGSNLPVDAEIARTREVVAPADRSGVLVRYPIRLNTSPAIVIFVRPDGKALPAGAHGLVSGGGNFVVGYEGRAYLKDLTADNAVTIDLPEGPCRASFKYQPRPNEQVTVPGVVCQ